MNCSLPLFSLENDFWPPIPYLLQQTLLKLNPGKMKALFLSLVEFSSGIWPQPLVGPHTGADLNSEETRSGPGHLLLYGGPGQ